MPIGTREKLITTATDLFYQNGFQAVGLDQILDAVGITKTAFYKHFESKDDLIVAVLEHRDQVDMTEWSTYFVERGGADPKSRLLSIFDLLDEWFAKPDFRGCLFMNASTEFPFPNDPIHRTAARHNENLHILVQKMAAAAGASDPDALARQMMLLIGGAIAGRHAGGDLNSAATARVTAELLVRQYCVRGRKAGALSS